MNLRGESVPPIQFDGLRILDYTGGLDLSSSLAHVSVPPGACHALSWSTRSDKYYADIPHPYVLSGPVHFTVDGEEAVLAQGDMCIVLRGGCSGRDDPGSHAEFQTGSREIRGADEASAGRP